MEDLFIGGIKAKKISWVVSSWKIIGISLISNGFA